MSYKIELVAPAGSPDALDAAIGEGADAVYLGLKDFNARLRAKNFSYKQLEAIVYNLHKIKKRVYLTLNTVIEEKELKSVYNLLKYLKTIEIDAVIIQDLGLLRMINLYYPDLRIHCSTQMNISSYKGANFLSKNGAKRVILGRELTFSEIKKIRENTSIELEVFVHGALCVSVSGLCLFSSYFGGRSANKGRCTQSCRRLYTGDDRSSGYFFSTKDLMLIKKIPDLIEIGINSLKIEGRMKNARYVGTVVRAYRYLIDNYQNRDHAINKSLEILENDLARDKTIFYFDDFNMDFINDKDSGEIGKLAGEIISIENGRAKAKSFIKLENNDIVRVHSNKDNFRESTKVTIDDNNPDFFILHVNNQFEIGDRIYLIEKSGEKIKYKRVIPNNLSNFKRHPGINEIPFENFKIKKENFLKDGIYVKIDDAEDIYNTLSIKPQKIIVDFNKKNIDYFINNKTPYKANEIIFYLSPLYYDKDENFIIENIDKLSQLNFDTYIINNVAHINLFKKIENIKLIGGEYLYTFNSFAIKFLYENGISYFISPLENNKKNIFSSALDKNLCFITIFSFPLLFKIRTNLREKYKFNYFFDSRNNGFYLINNEEFSFVIPEHPFSIIDKVSELKKSGFNKFIIDLSYSKFKKGDYKRLFSFIEKSINLPNTTRFNWKDGFKKE
ncbi:MAG TPA: peptidase U32 family protein [Spirochaetota bacterium]|nr:peptidase U32 family protein [Spirochaetota bacterium]